MLVTAFLVLGCLALALVILWLVPEKIWACIVVFGLTAWIVSPQGANTAIAAASVVALVYFGALLKFGTYRERKAARALGR